MDGSNPACVSSLGGRSESLIISEIANGLSDRPQADGISEKTLRNSEWIWETENDEIEESDTGLDWRQSKNRDPDFPKLE